MCVRVSVCVCVCLGGGGLVSTCVGVWIDSRSVLPSEGSISRAGVWVLSGLTPDPSRVPHFRNMTDHCQSCNFVPVVPVLYYHCVWYLDIFCTP